MSVYSLSVALTDRSWVLSKFRLVPNCPGAKLSGARMAQVVASWQAAGEDFFNLWGFFGPKGQKWGQIGAKFSVLNRWCQIVWCKNGWCQIVLTSNYLVPNCPSANLSWCQNIPDTKLSWPQTFFVLICLQSNRAGAKLSWYHIVLMPNCSCAILSGSKLSGCQTVLVPNWGKAFLISWGQIVMVPNCVVTNCPVAKFSFHQTGAIFSWCQIELVPNCPVQNCPVAKLYGVKWYGAKFPWYHFWITRQIFHTIFLHNSYFCFWYKFAIFCFFMHLNYLQFAFA